LPIAVQSAKPPFIYYNSLYAYIHLEKALLFDILHTITAYLPILGN